MELANNLGQLQDLLYRPCLANKVSGLVFQFQKAFNGSKDYWNTNISLSNLIDLWSDHDKASNNILGMLCILDSDSVSSGVMKFKRLQTSLSILPSMSTNLHKLDLIGRAYQREQCRTLVTIYDWYTASGPSLCHLLMTTYRSQGFDEMVKSAPFFALLVDHIVQYTYYSIFERVPNPAKKPKKSCSQAKESKPQKTPAKRACLDSDHPVMSQPMRRYTEFCDIPTRLFGPCPASLDKIPGNLYGIISSPKGQSSWQVPAIASK